MIFCENFKPIQSFLNKGYGIFPSPFNAEYYQEVLDAFDDFCLLIDHNPHLDQMIVEAGAKWRESTDNLWRYSNFFTPYYRNRIPVQGKDMKQIFQFCESFYQQFVNDFPYVYKTHPVIQVLFDKLNALLVTGSRLFIPIIHSLEPSLRDRLIPRDGIMPFSIRLLRYVQDDQMSTNPHVDKTAITSIVYTDDPAYRSSVIVAKEDKNTPNLSQYLRPEVGEEEALTFFGAAPREAGFSQYPPAPHAVMPFEYSKVRRSLIFFWHLPGIDMKPFSTDVMFHDDLGLAR